MRELATSETIERFFRALGERTSSPARIYVTGGVTAVLLGFRASTVDIDVKMIPDSDELLRAIPGRPPTLGPQEVEVLSELVRENPTLSMDDLV